MANTYSIIKKQQPYINPYDVNDIERTLAVKEGRYNANEAQVNQAIAQFSSIDLIREEDREYLYNNLKKVIDIVDNTDNIDFSKTGLGSDLATYISQAVDKNVLKQAANTRSIRNYNSNLEQIREKNPELYSQVNDQDARIQGGYYDYLSGEKNDLGSLNYVNFTDVQDNLIKKSKQLNDLNPDRVIKVPDGKGYFVEKQVKGLTQSEWLRVLPTMLTEQDRTQLAINGRVRYGYNNQSALLDINRIKQANTDKLDKALIDIDSKIELIADESSKEALKKEKRQIQDYYKKANASYDLVGNTAGKIGGYFLEQELVNNLASTMGATETIKYSEDGSYWKRIKQEAEDKKKLVDTNNFGDANKDGSPDFQTTATPVDTDDLGSVLKRKEDLQNNIERGFSKKLASIYNSFDADTKTKVDAIEQQVLKSHNEMMSRNPGLKPLTDLELHREVIDRVSLGDNSILTLQQKIDLKSDMDKMDAFNKAESEAFLKAESILFSKNAGEIYEELTTNPDIGMFGLDSGGTTFNQFLSKKGIKNKEDLAEFMSSNSEEANTFKANFLLQTYGDLRTLSHNIKGGFNPQIGFPNLNRDFLRRIKRAQELLGENTPIEEIFEPSRRTGNGSPEPITEEDFIEENSRFISLKNNGTKLNKILRDIANYSANTNIPVKDAFRYDRTLREDSHLFKTFNQDSFTEEYERALNLSTANITGQNIITIQPASGSGSSANYVPSYQDLITKAQPLGLVGLDPKLPLNIIKNKDNTYSIFQNQEGDDNPIDTKIGTISQAELEKLPNLSKEVDLYENKGVIDFNTQIRSEVPLLNYASSNARNSKQLQGLFNANTPQGRAKIMMASKDSVLDYLGTSLPGMNDKQKGPDYVSMVQKTLRNPNKFSLKMDSYEGISNVVVQMTNKEGEKVDIDSIDLSSNIDQKEFMDIYYATPQVFLTLALQNIGTEYLKTNNSTKIDLINNNL